MREDPRLTKLRHDVERELYELRVFGPPSPFRLELITGRLEDALRWSRGSVLGYPDLTVSEDVRNGRCSRHPRYQAKRPPRANCFPCRRIWAARNRGETVPPPDVSRLNITACLSKERRRKLRGKDPGMTSELGRKAFRWMTILPEIDVEEAMDRAASEPNGDQRKGKARRRGRKAEAGRDTHGGGR